MIVNVVRQTSIESDCESAAKDLLQFEHLLQGAWLQTYLAWPEAGGEHGQAPVCTNIGHQ